MCDWLVLGLTILFVHNILEMSLQPNHHTPSIADNDWVTIIDWVSGAAERPPCALNFSIGRYKPSTSNHDHSRFSFV